MALKETKEHKDNGAIKDNQVLLETKVYLVPQDPVERLAQPANPVFKDQLVPKELLVRYSRQIFKIISIK